MPTLADNTRLEPMTLVPAAAMSRPRSPRSAYRYVSVMLLAVLATGLLGAPASGAGRSKPVVALATGVSTGTLATEGQRLRWRLRGRHLTVVLPGPVYPIGRGPVTVIAQCGADAARLEPDDFSFAWAAVTGGSARVAGSARVLRLTLADDLAGQANVCAFAALKAGSLFTARRSTRMRVRRGRAQGCRPGPLEHVVLAGAKVRVTVVHAEPRDGTSFDGYRACLLPHGSLRRIAQTTDEGGAGGHGTTLERFTSAGTWLAWAEGYLPHSVLGGGASSSIRLVDMSAGRRMTIDTAPGRVTALAVSASGTAAWVREPNQIDGPPSPSGPQGFTFPAAQLRAQRPGAGTVLLDETMTLTCPATCHSGAEITDVAVSGQTVTWKHAGIPRAATLP